jgi:hypothetical protein
MSAARILNFQHIAILSVALWPSAAMFVIGYGKAEGLGREERGQTGCQGGCYA